MSFYQGVKDEYFEWLYDKVCKGRAHSKFSYVKLFEYLHQTEFIFIIPNDINRAKDGADLRYRFAMLKDDDTIMDILDGPCSVLEMMVALAIRCEESIMDDTQFGDRTGQWFWGMMSNLGIGRMDDDIYDEDYLNTVISRFLERRYEPNGKGGLFYIKDCEDDLRDVEIWIQLCWYLDNYV